MSFENDSIDMIYTNNNSSNNHNSQRRPSKPLASSITGQTVGNTQNSKFQQQQQQQQRQFSKDARCYSMDQSIRSTEQQHPANEDGDDNDQDQNQNQNEWNVWNVFTRMRQLKKKKKRKNSWDSIKDSEFEDLDAPNVHFRPEALETLCQLTKFNRKELKMIYRGFKQDAPSGVVREDSFKHIFSQFFPKGADVNQYAHYVFNTFDPERTGIVTFTDFVIGLSVLSRGSTEDKLKWIFSLYDVNCDGIISKDDLSRVIIAVYDLLGKCVQPQVDETTYKQHIDRVFKKLDLNQDGMVTYEIFMEACAKDENILRSFDVFNTLL